MNSWPQLRARHPCERASDARHPGLGRQVYPEPGFLWSSGVGVHHTRFPVSGIQCIQSPDIELLDRLVGRGD